MSDKKDKAKKRSRSKVSTLVEDIKVHNDIPVLQRIKFPIIWERITEGYRVQDLQNSKIDFALEIFKDYFVTDEPLCAGVGLAEDPDGVEEYLNAVSYWLKDTQSLAAIEEGTDSMVGCLVGRVLDKTARTHSRLTTVEIGPGQIIPLISEPEIVCPPPPCRDSIPYKSDKKGLKKKGSKRKTSRKSTVSFNLSDKKKSKKGKRKSTNDRKGIKRRTMSDSSTKWRGRSKTVSIRTIGAKNSRNIISKKEPSFDDESVAFQSPTLNKIQKLRSHFTKKIDILGLYGVDKYYSIHILIVNPYHRGKGIAKALIRSAIEMTNKFGCKIIAGTFTNSVAQNIAHKADFKEGIPVEENSTNNYDAKEFGPPCLQKDKGDVFGEEDCLFLNVYSPNLNGSLPVIFFIYGGAFTVGTTSDFNPDFFMETRRVVVVTVAYRLGPFGFLYLNDPEYPANLGIRDQILGLKWVYRNIGNFGGDPNKITLNGQSAGAASVSILMYSPMAKGLFVGGISESGTTCSPWALQPRCTGLYKLYLLTKIVGCDQHMQNMTNTTWSASPVVSCLRDLSPQQIFDGVTRFPKWNLVVTFPPIVESDSVANPVITVFPWLAQTKVENDVPWISGTNSAETYFIVKEYLPNDTWQRIAVRIFNGFILSDLLYYRYTAVHPMYITALIKIHFFSENLFHFENFLSQITSTAMFYYPTQQCLSISKSSAYGYYFNYESKMSRKQGYIGVGHGGELPFLWKIKYNIRQDGNDEDYKVSVSLVNSWIDFAYNQVASYANVTWEPYNESEDRMLIIDEHGARMGPNPSREVDRYWKTLQTNADPQVKGCDL